MGRTAYLRRILAAYLLPGPSQLTFWHETPAVNPEARPGELGPYWQSFAEKADYPGPFDPEGIPLLDYRGRLGLQYNPIAVAQYGLGNWNLWKRNGDPERRRKFLLAADWLAARLEPNPAGLKVWNHRFDWEYRDPLRAPWYSGLAQGQGISALVRAHQETGKTSYLEAAREAFRPLLRKTSEGGVLHLDDTGRPWIEEYLVSPPTHILNGFIWALWGVYDYHLATREPEARDLFDRCLDTLRSNLSRYDAGYWSLYEQSGTRLPMLASPFYHRLHIVQLRILHALTGDPIFKDFADRWEGYSRRRLNRLKALFLKSLFKLCYY